MNSRYQSALSGVFHVAGSFHPLSDSTEEPSDERCHIEWITKSLNDRFNGKVLMRKPSCW